MLAFSVWEFQSAYYTQEQALLWLAGLVPSGPMCQILQNPHPKSPNIVILSVEQQTSERVIKLSTCSEASLDFVIFTFFRSVDRQFLQNILQSETWLRWRPIWPSFGSHNCPFGFSSTFTHNHPHGGLLIANMGRFKVGRPHQAQAHLSHLYQAWSWVWKLTHFHQGNVLQPNLFLIPQKNCSIEGFLDTVCINPHTLGFLLLFPRKAKNREWNRDVNRSSLHFMG